jgi:hypothetical protein
LSHRRIQPIIDRSASTPFGLKATKEHRDVGFSCEMEGPKGALVAGVSFDDYGNIAQIGQKSMGCGSAAARNAKQG